MEVRQESSDMPAAKKMKTSTKVVVVGIADGISGSYSTSSKFCDVSDALATAKEIADDLIITAYDSLHTVGDMFPQECGAGSYEALWSKYKEATSDDIRSKLLKKMRHRVKRALSACEGGHEDFYQQLDEESGECANEDPHSRCMDDSPISIIVYNCATETEEDVTDLAVDAWLDKVDKDARAYCKKCKETGKWCTKD